jgi:DNA-directed RNA polymerase subunit K/omega
MSNTEDDYVGGDEDEFEYFPDSIDHSTDVIVISPENRRTSNRLSKYEMTEIVSIRAQQIAEYNNPMIDIGILDDPIEIAKKELMMRKCPLMLRRVVGEKEVDGLIHQFCEDWDPNTMTFTVVYKDTK